MGCRLRSFAAAQEEESDTNQAQKAARFAEHHVEAELNADRGNAYGICSPTSRRERDDDGYRLIASR
jgi:hypothetical protein